jgi:hypothetical protein
VIVARIKLRRTAEPPDLVDAGELPQDLERRLDEDDFVPAGDEPPPYGCGPLTSHPRPRSSL